MTLAEETVKVLARTKFGLDWDPFNLPEEEEEEERFGLVDVLDLWEDKEEESPFWTDRDIWKPGEALKTEEFKISQQEVRENPELAKLPEYKKGFLPGRWFKDHSNGQIPLGAMTKVGAGHYLRPDAAGAFRAMKRAAKKDGITLTITDSYRSFASQQALAAQKGLYSQGGLAAVPGTSEHGWGLAIDFGEGEQRNWLAKNGKKFGFKTIPREPWHWEYEGGFEGAAAPLGAKKKGRPTKTTVRRNKVENYDFGAELDYNPLSTIPLSLTEAYADRPSKAAKVTAPAKKVPGYVPEQYRKLFLEASRKHGVPVGLLAAVAKHESNFNPEAVSSAGAQGIMQIMPLHGLNKPFNPRQNVMFGAQYLASLVSRFDGNMRRALAGYNAGPNNYRAGLGYADMVLSTWRGR